MKKSDPPQSRGRQRRAKRGVRFLAVGMVYLGLVLEANAQLGAFKDLEAHHK